MIKYVILSLATGILFFCGNTYAQRKCGSSEHLLQQLATDPTFAKNRLDIEAFTKNFILKGGTRSVLQSRGTTLFTIPVVVHVVYNTTAQNVSDAQVQSQIDVLNKDFQYLNSDSGLVPAAFKPLVADCKFQFCLAKRDPSNNPSTGIVRKSTSVTAFSTNDNVKKSSGGGDNAWDATKYLNLWVCNMSGGILGYAQFPGGPAATDGVVILYSAFGTTGAAAAPFNLGRTATHEIGHWLNLYHIWGDDGSACTGTDEVGDTPNQASENYNCPTFPHVSCSNGPNGDMFMNYMDYVDDRCMQMFSKGQKDRMYAVLQSGGPRAALASSPGCVAPVTTGCGTPANAAATNINKTTATITWAAVADAASYSLQYKKTSAASFTTVSNLTTTNYALSGLSTGTEYEFKVKAICTSDTGNNTSVQTFTTLSATSNCTDNYEPNNSSSAAVSITANKTIIALISSASDKDYFKFTNSTSKHNIRITLSSLPGDYDMKLYSPSGTLLATSENGATTAENITYNTTTIGTYKVYVYGYNGAYNANTCYKLLAETSSNSFKESEDESRIKNVMKVYPVPASGSMTLSLSGYDKGKADVIVINQLGAMVMRKQLQVDAGTNDNKLDVSQLANGIYFLKVQQGKFTNTEKIYVKH